MRPSPKTVETRVLAELQPNTAATGRNRGHKVDYVKAKLKRGKKERRIQYKTRRFTEGRAEDVLNICRS